MNVLNSHNNHLNSHSTSENNTESFLALYNSQLNKIVSLPASVKSTNLSLKIENDELLKNMDQDEFEKFIIEIIVNNKAVKKIDLSKVINNPKLHSHIYNIIGNNFPIVGISRLIPGQRLVNITFLGIKILNDSINKEFVDLFVLKLKQVINNNFDQIIAGEKPGRLVRNNYKHLTTSIRKDLDISQKLFGGEESMDNLINKIFENITDAELYEVLISSGKKNISREKIKQIIKNTFDLGIGSCSIPEGKNKDKLISFYMGEISSRNKTALNNLGENLSFNFSHIKENAIKALEIETSIVEKYSQIKFIHEGINFDIIINGKISPILLKYIRKSEEVLVGNDYNTLSTEIGKYIDYLTNGFDFISPIINENDFNNIGKINEQISTGKIDIDLFMNNYKKSLTKEGLNSISKGKQGLRMFIDIVDMGIMNLTDFRSLAGKVVSGEITEDKMDELLKAGDTATNKFQLLVKKIKRDYPEAKISIGGDEVFIFIPGKTENQKDDIVNRVSENLYRFSLKGRISTSSQKNNGKIFDSLDCLTKINKIFEKNIEKLIHKDLVFSNRLLTNPSVTNIDIEDSKLNLLTQNLVFFINLLKQKISDNDLRSLILFGKSIKQKIEYEIKEENGEISKGILKIEIEKKNNFITIKIN